MTTTITVDIWHDAVCPWCRIGVANLQRAIADTGTAVALRLHPFRLDPSTPPEGRDLRAWLAARYGGADVEAMFARVTQVGATAGVAFHFERVRRGPQTLPAHVLLAAVPGERQLALLEALHVAYFERGEDIGDAAVLARLAAEAGWDAAAAHRTLGDAALAAQVAAEADSASRSGMGGVPHVIIGGRPIHGAQPVAVFAAALRAAAAAPKGASAAQP